MEAAVIIACLLFSAFFSGMEIAYVAANKVYLGVESQQKNFVSQVLRRLLDNPVTFTTAMLTGNTLALVLYGYYAGKAVAALPANGFMHFPYALPALQIILAGMVMLLVARFFPKVFFQVYANTLIRIFAVPAYIFYLLFYPVAKSVPALSEFLLRHVLRVRDKSLRSYLGRGELGEFVNVKPDAEVQQKEADAEVQIFRNAMAFSGRTAGDILTPGSEIAAVSLDDTVEELRQLFADTGYSKIMVYSGERGNIIGYVHSFELFSKPAAIASVVIPIESAAASTLIKDLLSTLTRKHKSVAVIRDTDGKTLGIVTIEDIIEELFGEIEDEHDAEDALELALKSGSYVFAAVLEVAYVNGKYGLNLPVSEAYTSLGGLMVHTAGAIPLPGTSLNIGGYKFKVLRGSDKLIEAIKITPLQRV